MFGPFYPPKLQAVVNHAERLAHALSSMEGRPPHGAGERVMAWIVGRHDEIEQFVRQVTVECTTEAAALEAISAYLAALHHGFVVHGLGPPPCCADPVAETTSYESVVTRDENAGLLQDADAEERTQVDPPGKKM